VRESALTIVTIILIVLGGLAFATLLANVVCKRVTGRNGIEQ